MYIPPFTARTCPVIYDASSDARKHTAAATSSTVPRRASGICPAQSACAFSASRPRHVRLNQSRRDDVDRDPARGHLARQRLGESYQPRLRRRVVGLPGVPRLPDHRADGDDPAAALLEHRPDGRLREHERRGQVRRQHRVPVLALHPHQQLIAGDAGIADDDVEPAVPARRSRPAASRPPPRRSHPGSPPRPCGRPPRAPAPCPPAWSPRAAAITIAPCSPRRLAIARPMPRDAPVTSATFPERLNIVDRRRWRRTIIDGRFDRREIVGAAEADGRRFAVNLAHESAQHRARTHLNIRCDAFRRKALDDASHRTGAETCRTSASIAAAASRFGSASTLATTGHARVRGRQRTQLGRQPLFRRLHQRAVKGRADRQRHDAPGAERLGPLAGPLDGLARPGNHDLPGAVQVRGADHFAVRPPRHTPARPCRHRGPRIAAIAPSPTGTASCMYRPRRRTISQRVAETRRCPPRRWPSTRRGCGRRRRPASCRAIRAGGTPRC